MAEQKEIKQEKKVYTYQDLIKFSNLDIYSGFGDVKESLKPSAPKFSFGTSTRDAEPKKFQNKDMAKIDCFGTHFIIKENRLRKGLTTMFMISFYIRRVLSIRLEHSLATPLIPKQNMITISERTLM